MKNQLSLPCLDHLGARKPASCAVAGSLKEFFKLEAVFSEFPENGKTKMLLIFGFGYNAIFTPIYEFSRSQKSISRSSR
ncbi:MAG: hypothetical protein V7K21_03115 [Nostoc sp.]|uniref:hypothetical protein n=1 Tax=Nostoc sp. TaxID=1180 RepID=UPI002FFD48DA